MKLTLSPERQLRRVETDVVSVNLDSASLSNQQLKILLAAAGIEIVFESYADPQKARAVAAAEAPNPRLAEVLQNEEGN